MNRRAVRRRCSLLVVAALGGCSDKSRESALDKQPLPPADVVVKDRAGTVLAELKATRPCRAMIGPQEMIVGGPPIISTLGSTPWTGVDDVNGTTFMRNDERIARLFPINDKASGAVFDMRGIAQVRVIVTGTTAVVENAATIPVRKLTLANGAISTEGEPALTITGTDDLILAALLSAPELLPEVRMLAACERVLLSEKAPTK